MIPKEQFTDLMAGIGMARAAAEYDAFKTYCEELKVWNGKMNLTAITDDEGIAVKHFADSLLPLTMVELPERARVIDVGSGAGFPGLPMAIVRRDLRLTFLDSLNKRLIFLSELSELLGIDAVTLHSRAEDAGRNPVYREKYDVVTARAVAPLPQLAEYCLPLVNKNGIFLALKGAAGREEAKSAENAIKTLGGVIEKITDYALPGGDARVLIVVRKVLPTHPRYPRETSQIKKKPL